jgi:hypothetical protein
MSAEAKRKGSTIGILYEYVTEQAAAAELVANRDAKVGWPAIQK